MRVGESLRQLLGKRLGDVHRGRVRTVLAVAEALVSEKRLGLTALGRALAVQGGGREKHGIKRVDRLLGNRHLWEELRCYFRALAHTVLGDRERCIILVDWTQLTGDLYALVASVPMEGRSAPIYHEVHPKKLVGNRFVQHRFLDRLAELVPEDRTVVVVTDAGFHAPWFEKVRQLGWQFLGRLSASIRVRRPRQKRWRRADSLWRQARYRPVDLGDHVVSKRRTLDCRLLLFKHRLKGRTGHRGRNRRGIHPAADSYKKCQRRYRSPWLLTTSFDGPALEVVHLYSLRMQCEESFRDYKSHRFGFSFEDLRTHSPERASVLLLIAALAHLLITTVGRVAENAGLSRHFQANTVRSRRVLSHFTLGLRILTLDRPRSSHPSRTRPLFACLRDPRIAVSPAFSSTYLDSGDP